MLGGGPLVVDGISKTRGEEGRIPDRETTRGEEGGTPDRECKKWFAVHSSARGEALAAEGLAALGLAVWFPRVLAAFRRGKARRLVEVERAYFPRYLFVGIGQGDSFGAAIHGVNECKGVATVVHLGGRPLQIPEAVMADLMLIAGPDGIVGRMPELAENKTFEACVGDKVKLAADSPFGGLVREISALDRLDSHDEIGLWLEMLGTEHQVYVPVTAVGEIVS